jgi:hypothetical protein
MKLVDQRYLDGANRYCTEPCLLSILDLGHPAPYAASDLQRLRERLRQVLPGLRQGRSLIGVVGDDVDAPCRGLQLARLIQGVTIELHRLTGDEVLMGFVGRVPKMASRYRLILPFRCGTVANAALQLAISLVGALLRGAAFALDEGLAELRGIAAAGMPTAPPSLTRIAA